MNWLSNHFWQLFDGVGGAAVIGIISWIGTTLFKRHPPVTVLENSTLTNAPVAVGSGNNQNVSAPVINTIINLPPQAAAPVAPEPAAVQPAPPAARRPSLNMIVTNTLVAGVSMVEEGVWTEDADRARALLIEFTNEASMAGPNLPGIVKAQLVYREDGVREIRRVTGAWLHEGWEAMPFRVDDTHRLIVGLMFGEGDFQIIGKRRYSIDIASDGIHTDYFVHPNFVQGAVRVRLTESRSGDVLYEGDFQLNTHPPEVIRPRID